MRMTAASSHRRLLAAGAVAAYVGVFIVFTLVEQPGLGIGHFFYVPIALLALATGPLIGAAGGVAAAVLYVFAILVNPDIPPEHALTLPAGIRVLSFATMGMLIGFYAARNRELVARLRLLAERDALTGLPNTRAFESAIARRLAVGEPFALLVGDLDAFKEINDQFGHGAGNDVLQRLGKMLGNALRADDDLARVGGDEFAVLTSLRSSEEAAQLAARLEAVLRDQGSGITFGWALHPQEGSEALSLYRAADERLYARKLVRSRRTPELPVRLVATSAAESV